MEHSKNFSKVQKWYTEGKWNKAMVHDAVGRWITEAEYKELTGEDYVK